MKIERGTVALIKINVYKAAAFMVAPLSMLTFAIGESPHTPASNNKNKIKRVYFEQQQTGSFVWQTIGSKENERIL